MDWTISVELGSVISNKNYLEPWEKFNVAILMYFVHWWWMFRRLVFLSVAGIENTFAIARKESIIKSN